MMAVIATTWLWRCLPPLRFPCPQSFSSGIGTSNPG